MNRPRIASVVPVMASLLLLASCGDSGSDPVTPPAGLSLGSTSLTLQAGDTARVAVGGGTAPYGIRTAPSAAVAAAFLSGTTLAVAAVAPGSTSVVVEDASNPAQTATLQVTVAGQPPVSFAGQIQPIFNASCVGCHGGTAGLFLAAGQSYGSLVNVAAGTGACAGIPRVAPGNSAGSALYRRVSGTCSQRMPLGGTLAAAEIELIRRWIDEGAANN